MLAVLFEVTPKPGQEQAYLDMAAAMRPDLERHDGLLYIERFRNLRDPRRLLSHQFWRDEACLATWRRYGPHRTAQRAGRHRLFETYRLRIVEVGAEIMPGTPPATMPGVGDRNVLIAATTGQPFGEEAHAFASLYRDDAFVALSELAPVGPDRDLLDRLAAMEGLEAARTGVVRRDYGMFERAEAPQELREAD